MSSLSTVEYEVPSWTRALAKYRRPSAVRSTCEIIVTALPFAAFWGLASLAVANGNWAGLFLTIPAAAFLVRMFILQHDCGHGALFQRRALNDWTGRVIGVLTLTPYDYWRRTHAVHHATSGNLSRRGIGDINTLTVREFGSLPWTGRLHYWLYRHPFVMFGVGPIWLFLGQYRLPLGLMRSGLQPWASTLATNLAIAILVGALIWLIGVGPFVMVQLPVTLMASTVGVWLFYVQHQFETTHWSEQKDWNFHHAALHGSSHYDLPFPIRWFTGNIGIHHVHHLAASVPFYRLPEVMRDHPGLRNVGRMTLLESLTCVKLVLWDEEAKRLVSFREARRDAVRDERHHELREQYFDQANQ